MTAALEGAEWSATRRGRTLPPGKTRYPFYRRLGGPQGRSGRAEKSRPHRDSIPDRPARSHSLYRLSYPVHTLSLLIRINHNVPCVEVVQFDLFFRAQIFSLSVVLQILSLFNSFEKQTTVYTHTYICSVHTNFKNFRKKKW